jgi:hypothetical protein
MVFYSPLDTRAAPRQEPLASVTLPPWTGTPTEAGEV